MQIKLFQKILEDQCIRHLCRNVWTTSIVHIWICEVNLLWLNKYVILNWVTNTMIKWWSIYWTLQTKMFKGSDQILCANQELIFKDVGDTSVLSVCRHFRKSDGLNVHGANISNYYVSMYVNIVSETIKQRTLHTSSSCMCFFWILQAQKVKQFEKATEVQTRV